MKSEPVKQFLSRGGKVIAFNVVGHDGRKPVAGVDPPAPVAAQVPPSQRAEALKSQAAPVTAG